MRKVRRKKRDGRQINVLGKMSRSPERERALALATLILDRCDGDPDDDLSVLSRQLIRAQQEVDALRKMTSHESEGAVMEPITAGQLMC
jgi:hypothetical protein